MRFHLLGLIGLALVATPAAAQRNDNMDKRVDRLEQEMRAVQRRVFPGANVPYVGAEIGQPQQQPQTSGVPATGAVADLQARLDALETQLRELTGQVEEDSNRLRRLEAAFSRYQDSVGARLDALERPVQPEEPAPVEEPAETEDAASATTPAAPAADAAEAAYNAGYRLWEQKRYADAQRALTEVGKKWPKSRWASWANNLAGRAYLDDGKPEVAAKIFLDNYQGNRKGERAADSLFFLGQALVAAKRPEAACKAYAELEDVYGETMRPFLKDRLPAARKAAKCG